MERDQLERHLLDCNRDSFRAASESPCGHGVNHDSITFSSLSPASVKSLAGKVPADWHNDNDELREFLGSFTVPDSVWTLGELPSEISADDIKYGFKTGANQPLHHHHRDATSVTIAHSSKT